MEKRKIYLGFGILCILIIGVIFVHQNKNIEASDIEEKAVINNEALESTADADEAAHLKQLEISEARAEWFLENGGLADPDGDIYAKGKTIQISKEEFDLGLVKYKVEGNEEEAEENIIKALTRSKILYNLAVDNGYTASDDEIQQEIERMKETTQIYEEIHNRKSPLTIEIEAFETEELYWDGMYDTYRRRVLINKYIDDLKTEKATEWNLQNSFFELEERWSEYYEEYGNQLVEEEDVKIQ